MAKQCLSYIQKMLKKISKGQKVTGLLSYLNDIDTLLAAKGPTPSLESVSDIDFLDKALAIRAANAVKRTTDKIKNSTENKKTLHNDIVA